MPEITSTKDSRTEFIDVLIELAEKDDKILLIVPDVGFNYIDKFKDKFPNRFFNFGVTEQSTIMIATGLALQGFKPYVYSMVNFVLFRPYEMVRNGIVNHHANVKLIGVKGSSAYKFLGFSHNMNDDFEDMKACSVLGLDAALPLKIEDVRKLLLDTYQSPKPFYIRL